MKTSKNYIIGLALAATMLLGVSTTKADLLSGYYRDHSVSNGHHFNFGYTNNHGRRPVVHDERWVGEMQFGDNVATGERLQFFCVDISTHVSQAFLHQFEGQFYQAMSFNDAVNGNVALPLTYDQHFAIQTLFNHTYSSLLDAQDIYASATGRARTAALNDVLLLSMGLQFSVWEIMHESDMNAWDIRSGQLSVTNPSSASMYNQLTSLTDSWFDSLLTGIWADEYANATLWEITYFYAPGNVSQPFISVTGINDPAVVPEPATLAMLGLGLAGLGIARRRVRK